MACPMKKHLWRVSAANHSITFQAVGAEKHHSSYCGEIMVLPFAFGLFFCM